MIATITSPAVWPLLVSVSAATLTLSAGAQRLADWCEASALGMTVAEWRDLNRARLRTIASVREAVKNRPARSITEIDWAAPPESHRAEKNLGTGVHVATAHDPPAPIHDPPSTVAVASPRPDEARTAPGTVARPVPEIRAGPPSGGLLPRAESTIAAASGRVQMGAKDQINEFLEDQAFLHLTRARKELRLSCEAWFHAYEAWACRRALVALPEKSFFAMLNKADGITKSRPRLRDPATGRVAHNRNGTPSRQIFYTFTKPRRCVASKPATQAWGIEDGWRHAA